MQREFFHDEEYDDPAEEGEARVKCLAALSAREKVDKITLSAARFEKNYLIDKRKLHIIAYAMEI